MVAGPLAFNSDSLSGKSEPGFECDFVVHFREEGVDAARLLYQIIIKRVLIILLLFTLNLILNLLRDQEDAILSPKLKYLHLSAQFHISEFFAHASVKEFVEENVAVVALNTHLQNVLLQFMSGNFSVEAKGTFIVVVASKFPEEHLKLIFPYFKATVSFLGEHFPYSVELVQVIFEGLD